LWRTFLIVVGAVLFGPLLILVFFSFNDSNVLALPFEGLTLRWYRAAISDSSLHAALLNSTIVALVVAPLCLVLGTLAAFGLTRFRFRGRGAVAGLVAAPLILPWLVIGIAALMAYARADITLGLPTVIATQAVCTFPLVTAIVGAQLFRFERVQEEAAIDLGCNRIQVLRFVVFPHIAPARWPGSSTASPPHPDCRPRRKGWESYRAVSASTTTATRSDGPATWPTSAPACPAVTAPMTRRECCLSTASWPKP